MRATVLAWVIAVAACSKAPPCTLCGGTACVDTRVDSLNCGACGAACEAGTRCEQGSCVSTCSGLTCGEVCVDPRFDPSNCGACGVVCSAPHSTPTCLAGRCVPGVCDVGWRNCDFDERNGCESNVASCARDVCGTLLDGGKPSCQLQSISADGGRVLFSSSDNGLVPEDTNFAQDLFLYDATTQRLRWMTRPVDGGAEIASIVFPAAISGDGESVAFVAYDIHFASHHYICDVQTGQQVELPTSDGDSGVELQGGAMTIPYDGRFIATVGQDAVLNYVVRVDTKTGAFAVKTAEGGVFGNPPVALSGDGRVLGYGDFVDGDGRPQLFDVEHGVVRPAFDLADAGLAGVIGPMTLALDFDGSHAAVSGQSMDSQVRVWVAAAGPSGLGRYADGGMAVFEGEAPALSADGRVAVFQRIANGSTSQCAAFDVATGLPLQLAEAFQFCTPRLSADGRVLAVDTGEGVFLVGVNRP